MVFKTIEYFLIAKLKACKTFKIELHNSIFQLKIISFEMLVINMTRKKRTFGNFGGIKENLVKSCKILQVSM